MSENRNRGIRDYSQYDSMTSEELEQILRSDAEAPEGAEPDVELLLYIMGVLADRRRNSENTGNTAQEAYESFKKYYLPREENESDTQSVETPKKRPLVWLRRLSAAAAVLAFVFLGSLTANAFGFDIWNSVAKWAQETFFFESGAQTEVDTPSSDEKVPYSSLQDALSRNNEDSSTIPTWIPDGFQLVELEMTSNPLRRKYTALYQNDEAFFKISVQSCIDSDPEQIERSEGFVETYESEGVIYYFFTNYNLTRVAWINGSYECYISGALTIEQLKTMIDSIEKG